MTTQHSRVRLDSVERAISAVLNHGQFVLGPEVAELEERDRARAVRALLAR